MVYNRPEKSDTSFLWSEFDNNLKTLNDNIGNFIHRTLTFINKQFNGKIPKKIKYDAIDKKFISKLNKIGSDIGGQLDEFNLRKALREIVTFAKENNLILVTQDSKQAQIAELQQVKNVWLSFSKLAEITHRELQKILKNGED